ncbi:D-3-phosphoglycerate dehydrogenase [Opitutia bacterium]|jgi:D-3-phosphoglycerate dehydrogenase|nr:D-3-phosphoglycerate dehydrogenase [Opitutae bacterium]
MPKVLVADKISPTGVALLKSQPGYEVIEAYGSTPEKILTLVGDVHAILVRSETQITKEVLAAAHRLVCVGRAGVGVDNIDVDAATERGVIVMNTPSGNTIATAELTFTHLLSLARPVPEAVQSMREGKWDRKTLSGTELFGKTLGVLGLGRIGAEVAKRALAFGMKVAAYDPYLTEARAKSLGVIMATLDEVFVTADYITVHMPLTEQTEGMVNAAAFAKMKKGVKIVNCARGGIVDEAALAAALASGQCGGCGFDVFVEEPLAKDHPLRSLPKAHLSPHLGASTSEAQENVGVEVAEAAITVLGGGSPANAVNLPSVDSQTLAAIRPFQSLAEKLGAIARQLAAPGRVESLRLTTFGAGSEQGASAIARSIQRGYLRGISEGVNDVNAPSKLKALGVEVQSVRSSAEADYKELVLVEAFLAGGKSVSVAGTILGKAHSPRIVSINGRTLEFVPEGKLLLIENQDQPGIIGALGTLLAQERVNIANMALSRTGGANALAVYQLDTAPGAAALAEILRNPAIVSAKLIDA